MIRFVIALVLCSLLFTSCAPPVEKPKKEDEGSGVSERGKGGPVDAGSLAGGDNPVGASGRSPSGKGSDAGAGKGVANDGTEAFPGALDPRTDAYWRKRANDLYGSHLAAFTAPPIGSMVGVMLTNGTTHQGQLVSLTEQMVQLSVKGAEVGFQRNNLDPRSRAVFFQEDYGRFQTIAQVRAERQKWIADNAPPTPTPVPVAPVITPMPRLPATGGGGYTGRNPSKPGAPRNLPPDGRVPQVLEYLEGSLRRGSKLEVLDWGPVHPHGDGYSVKVRYNVTIPGLGVSKEDMIFFMRSTGKVYRKASWKPTHL